MLSSKYLVGAALFVATSCSSWAAAPVYFNLGGLVLIIVGIVFALFALFGGGKGIVAFFVLIVGFGLWSSIKQSSSERAAQTAREAISDRCLRGAGNVGEPIQYEPNKIFVRIDGRLSPGAENRVRISISTLAPAPSISFVNEMPLQREANSAYVDISVIQEKINGAEQWYLDGIQTTVYDGKGSIVAKQVDYRRDFDWCLRDYPPASIERFLTHILGRRIGLVNSEALLIPPARSP